MLEPGYRFSFPKRGETTEIVETPQQSGNRYRVRVTVQPSKGPPAHVHPSLVERFAVEAGNLRFRVGADRKDLIEGDTAEVPAGVRHGFRNTGNTPAALVVDLVFGPQGLRPTADLIQMAAAMAQRVDAGEANRFTGMPGVLQTAVFFDYYREGMAFPGPTWLQDAIIGPLAALGRWRGYNPELLQPPTT